jgi:glycosyltransferase involved in cell wall biosynthesis
VSHLKTDARAVSRTRSDSRPLRIALVYDCLYPFTIGGAEKWYRDLAIQLGRRHHVTYLTRTQWPRAKPPEISAEVEIVGLGPADHLYTSSGRRRFIPPIVFGLRVFAHLLKNRDKYDIVHTGSFPFFPLIAASLARAMGGAPVVTTWIEVWPTDYWRHYAGNLRGRIGAAVQKFCINLTGTSFTFSELTARALRDQGCSAEPVVLTGMYDGASDQAPIANVRKPLIIFVGRHIPEKHVVSIPAAVAIARRSIPDLHATIFGDGPERSRLLSEIGRLELSGVIDCPGFVSEVEIARAMTEASCLLLPSEREGYGLVVVEAAAHGTPSIVISAPNNAASALVADGVNGYIAPSPMPEVLADAIERVLRNRETLSVSSRAWFDSHRSELDIACSVERMEQTYRAVAGDN